MLAPLVDSNRAQQNPWLKSCAVSSPAYLASLLASASDAVRRHCMRDFSLTNYSEYYSGAIYIREPLKLRQYPVKEIQGIKTAQQCMQIVNTSGTIQRATVETLNDGASSFKLTTYSSGVPTVVTLSGLTYPTVGTMAAAITALGNGWGTPSIMGGAAGSYANFPTADLKPLQGAASALVGGTWLEIYEDWYGWNSGAGRWPDEGGNDGSYGGPSAFWRLDNETGEIWGHLPRGFMNLRIDYTAGFDQVPGAVQEATVELMAWMYQRSRQNVALTSAKLGSASATLDTSGKWPTGVVNSLSYFKVYDKLINR